MRERERESGPWKWQCFIKIKNNKMSTHQRVWGWRKRAMKTIFTAHLSRPISRGCSDEFTNAANLKQRMAFKEPLVIIKERIEIEFKAFLYERETGSDGFPAPRFGRFKVCVIGSTREKRMIIIPRQDICALFALLLQREQVLGEKICAVR